ncbi:unnamed protein product [Prorocentrum cordatum]|uniref:Uncharacterized protein n=1 Tax=Prorocentrum cordatum TaxID=2364126 RepID=A0ABN9YAS3_9DINO|nr:unnamed protein product [Polarella glacialis]
MVADFSTADDPGSIFECFDDRSFMRCPGGNPGDCGSHRLNTSLACLKCEPGMAPDGNGQCTVCRETSLLIPVGAAVTAVFVLIAAYHFIATEKRAEQNNLRVLAVSVAGQLLAVMQILAVCATLAVSWPSPFSFVLAIAKAFAFEVEILRFACIVDPSPVWDYSMKIVLFFFVVAAMFVVHLVYSALCYKRKDYSANTVFVGTLGTIVMACFIIISMTIFSPFRCMVHPNGVMTVQSVPEVVCYDSDEHGEMIMVGFLASSIPVGFLVMVAWAVWQLPYRMAKGNAEFLQMFSFLFFRFRPASYWYVFFLLSRNLAVALVPLVPNVTGQLFVMFVIMCSSAMVSAVAMPWRISMASMLDVFVAIVLLFVVYMGALLADLVDRIVVAWLATIMCAGIVVFFLLILTYVLIRRHQLRQRKTFQFFLCHHKVSAGAFCRLLKVHLLKDRRTRGFVFLDADYLEDLNKLFSYVSSETETLAALCTKELLTRPWCAGELTTARLTSIDVVLIVFPCFEWPTEDFISNYQEFVPGVNGLTGFGISVDMVQKTLRLFHTNNSIELPDVFDTTVLSTTADLLFQRKRRRKMSIKKQRDGDDSAGEVVGVAAGRMSGASLTDVQHAAYLILVDYKRNDAICTGLIVKELLTKECEGFSERIPQLLPRSSQVPAVGKVLMIVCTTDCLRNPMVAKAIMQSAELGLGILPIIGESGFQFPTQALFDDMRAKEKEVLSGVSMFGHFGYAFYVDCIKFIFSVIGVNLIPQEGESQINMQIKTICARMLGDTQVFRTLEMEVYSLGLGRVEGNLGLEEGTELFCSASLLGAAAPATEVGPLGDHMLECHLFGRRGATASTGSP